MVIVYFNFVFLASKVQQKIEESCLMVNFTHVHKDTPQNILFLFIAVLLIGQMNQNDSIELAHPFVFRQGE